MARKRMIDPDFWTDEKLGNCKRDERLLFMGLISNADDEGRGRANVKLLKSSIFPYDDDVKVKDMESMLCTLMDKKIIYIYIIEGQEFYYLPNFSKHQVINKFTPSKLPKLPEIAEEVVLPEYYGSTTVVLPPNIKEKNRIEKNIKEEKKKYSDYVFLSDSEYQKLIDQFGEQGTTERIENLSLYKGSTGKKYASDYLTILNWERKNKDAPKQQFNPNKAPNKNNHEQRQYSDDEFEGMYDNGKK